MGETTITAAVAQVRDFARSNAGADMPLAHKTARMGRLVHRYYAESARAHGGPAGSELRGQGRVLALLRNKPQTTQRELQFVLDMRQQSLSELLAKLEEKGYITRSKSPDDGRVTLIELTEAGAAAAPDPDAVAQRADVFDCLDADDRARFEGYVDQINASIAAKLVELGVDPDAPRPDRRDPRGPRNGRGPRGGDPHDGRGPRDGRGPCGPDGHHAGGPRHRIPRHDDLRAEFEANERDDRRGMRPM